MKENLHVCIGVKRYRLQIRDQERDGKTVTLARVTI